VEVWASAPVPAAVYECAILFSPVVIRESIDAGPVGCKSCAVLPAISFALLLSYFFLSGMLLLATLCRCHPTAYRRPWPRLCCCGWHGG
jgi:hypothetical protein